MNNAPPNLSGVSVFVGYSLRHLCIAFSNVYHDRFKCRFALHLLLLFHFRIKLLIKSVNDSTKFVCFVCNKNPLFVHSIRVSKIRLLENVNVRILYNQIKCDPNWEKKILEDLLCVCVCVCVVCEFGMTLSKQFSSIKKSEPFTYDAISPLHSFHRFQARIAFSKSNYCATCKIVLFI